MVNRKLMRKIQKHPVKKLFQTQIVIWLVCHHVWTKDTITGQNCDILGFLALLKYLNNCWMDFHKICVQTVMVTR